MSLYRKLPIPLKIAIAATFAWAIVLPIYIADGIIRGVVLAWHDYMDLYRDGMGNLRKRGEGKP